MALTDKQQIFVDEYLKCFNATEAARRAGYAGNDNTLAVVGWENLRKPYIKEIIDQRLQESAMSADEVIARLAAQARGNIDDFITFKEGVKLPFIDLQKAHENGLMPLVKKLKYDKDGHLEFELYDAQAALRLLGQHHGLFTERSISSNLNIDVSDLTDEQLERIANGDDPLQVLSAKKTEGLEAKE